MKKNMIVFLTGLHVLSMQGMLKTSGLSKQSTICKLVRIAKERSLRSHSIDVDKRWSEQPNFFIPMRNNEISKKDARKRGTVTGFVLSAAATSVGWCCGIDLLSLSALFASSGIVSGGLTWKMMSKKTPEHRVAKAQKIFIESFKIKQRIDRSCIVPTFDSIQFNYKEADQNKIVVDYMQSNPEKPLPALQFFDKAKNARMELKKSIELFEHVKQLVDDELIKRECSDLKIECQADRQKLLEGKRVLLGNNPDFAKQLLKDLLEAREQLRMENTKLKKELDDAEDDYTLGLITGMAIGRAGGVR